MQNIISNLPSYKNENPLKFAIKSEKYSSFFSWSATSLAACVALNSNLHANQQQPHDLKSLLCVSNSVLSEEDCLQSKNGETIHIDTIVDIFLVVQMLTGK